MKPSLVPLDSEETNLPPSRACKKPLEIRDSTVTIRYFAVDSKLSLMDQQSNVRGEAPNLTLRRMRREQVFRVTLFERVDLSGPGKINTGTTWQSQPRIALPSCHAPT